MENKEFEREFKRISDNKKLIVNIRCKDGIGFFANDYYFVNNQVNFKVNHGYLSIVIGYINLSDIVKIGEGY